MEEHHSKDLQEIPPEVTNLSCQTLRLSLSQPVLPRSPGIAQVTTWVPSISAVLANAQACPLLYLFDNTLQMSTGSLKLNLIQNKTPDVLLFNRAPLLKTGESCPSP